MAKLQAGAINLDCTVACSWGWVRERARLRAFDAAGDWEALAVKVAQVGYQKDLAYYYLGRAAAGLGYPDAALRYYRESYSLATGTKAGPQCRAIAGDCMGVDLLTVLPQKLNPSPQPIAAASTKQLLALTPSQVPKKRTEEHGLEERSSDYARATKEVQVAFDSASPTQLLDTVYGRYDRKHACWPAIDPASNQRYCMKIDRVDKVSTDSGRRLYVLAVGKSVDDKGELLPVHALPGLVGAFFLEERNGHVEILASDARIRIGTFGAAPSKWKFVRLGPSDYWGWQNTTNEDCGQGECGSGYRILAPHRTSIREIAAFGATYNNGGACGVEGASCAPELAAIKSKLVIDTTQSNDKVFPLLITVSGVDKGKKLTNKTWTIPFDPITWSYIEPRAWPLRDRGF